MELKGRGYYNNSLQYHEPYRSWLIHFVKEWGRFLSTPESWNEEFYHRALADERFGLQKGWYEEPSRWQSFNDFFARYLKSADQRPIASPGDVRIIVSPADSKPQGLWKIDGESRIVDEGVRVKSQRFQTVEALLGVESAFTDAFANGALTHTFLDVNDYHRYHFPVSGTVREVRIIPGDVAAGGKMRWDEVSRKYFLKSKTPGWQSIETRGCVILENEEIGLVALLPVGMSQVSSVQFEDKVQVGSKVKKGDMLGHFLFGGSNFVMLLQEGLDMELSSPKDGSVHKHVLMGEEYARVRRNRLN